LSLFGDVASNVLYYVIPDFKSEIIFIHCPPKIFPHCIAVPASASGGSSSLSIRIHVGDVLAQDPQNLYYGFPCRAAEFGIAASR
jgi:hypothetical protein